MTIKDGDAGGTMKSEWDFDETIRGTIRGMPVELDLEELTDEEWDLEREVGVESGGTARRRSVLEGSTLNVSWTVLTNASGCADGMKASDVSLPLSDRSSQDPTPTGTYPHTPGSEVADLQSSNGSGTGRSTWKQRHDQRGAVVKEGDVGNG